MRRPWTRISLIAFVVATAVAAVAQQPQAQPPPAGEPAAGEPAPSPVPVAGVADDYQPAKLLSSKRPQYPALAARNKIEGTVLVRFVVDTNGKVKDARVVQGIPDLHEAALESVRGWKFKPAIRAGRKAKVTLEAPVVFQLAAE
jgi:periplasmic protein TonB